MHVAMLKGGKRPKNEKGIVAIMHMFSDRASPLPIGRSYQNKAFIQTDSIKCP